MELRKSFFDQQDVLTPDSVESAFRCYLPQEGGLSVPSFTPAAVLIPLMLREEGLTVLFTRRALRMTHHAGQICFPGGRMEQGETPVMTALRESAEEIGLAAGNARVIGRLSRCFTDTRFSVTPVVALVKPQDFTPSPREVAEIFEVPLDMIAAKGVLGPGHRPPVLAWGGRLISGATARMVRDLAGVVHGP